MMLRGILMVALLACPGLALPQAGLPPPKPPAIVAIVIDDIESVAQVEAFLEIPAPLTFAILPTAQGASAVAARLSVLHREYMIHLPMEPVEADLITGPGFLNTMMDDAVIQAVLDRHIGAVPGAKGANNHMGSRFTQDRARMEAVLRVLARHKMYFIDSRTTHDTVGKAAAVAVGIPELDRDVFLDNEPEESAVLARLDELVHIALERGCAVGIGHPRPTTLGALKRFVGTLKPGELTVVPPSALLNSPCRN